MSATTLFTDLPNEIQYEILTEFLGSPYDIRITRNHGHTIDSRTDFAALWSVKKSNANIEKAFLDGFSGLIDLTKFKCQSAEDDPTQCQPLAYQQILDGVPKDRVKVIDLGELGPCHCEGIALEDSDDVELLDPRCRRAYHIDQRFAGLEKIRMTQLANPGLPWTDSAAEFMQFSDGRWDGYWTASLQERLRNTGPNYNNAVRQSPAGSVVPVEISMYHLICVLCSDPAVFTQGMAHHFYVVKHESRGGNDLRVLSRSIATQRP